MSPHSGGVPVGAIRDALRRAVVARRLRPVSREVGISAQSLRHFLNERHEPQERTLQKLTAWYAREAPDRRDPTEADVHALAALLFRKVPDGDREWAVETLLRTLADIHRELGITLPKWLRPPKKREK